MTKNDSHMKENKKKIKEIFDKLDDKYGRHAEPEGETLLDHLIYYHLAYYNPFTSAKRAFKAITNPDDFVDWNELRVTQERDIRTILDESNCEPNMAALILAILKGIFAEFNQMSLEFLREETPAKARKQLSKIDPLEKSTIDWLVGLVHGFDTVPVEERTYLTLTRTGVAPTFTAYEEMEEFLQGLLDKDEVLHFHHAMIEHGKKTCVEEWNMKCTRCIVRKHCLYFEVTEGKHNKKKSSQQIVQEALENGKKSKSKKKSGKKKTSKSKGKSKKKSGKKKKKS